MLVSKIKPCMSKYKQVYTVKLRTAHYISNYFFDGQSHTTWITVVILELIHAENFNLPPKKEVYLLDKKSMLHANASCFLQRKHIGDS